MEYEKRAIVEARQYDGPKLNLVHEQLGEQTANAGDWLLGTERGRIEVVSNEKFLREWKAYSPTEAEDELAAAKSAVTALEAKLAAAEANGTGLEEQLALLEKEKAEAQAAIQAALAK